MAAKWFLADEKSSRADEVLGVVGVEGALVPAIFSWEIQNLLLTAKRDRRITVDEVGLALAALSALAITVADPRSSSPSFEKHWKLADEYALSVYDAGYLFVCLEINRDLVTADWKLYNAAKKARVRAEYIEASAPTPK